MGGFLKTQETVSGCHERPISSAPMNTTLAIKSYRPNFGLVILCGEQ
jgi:hypothetical protein